MPVFNSVLLGIKLQYSKGWSGDSLSDSIGASFQRDFDRGATGPGPHRADLSFTLDGFVAKDRLSRGEQKSLTAALLMAQAKMICASGDKPVLLLDDVASELDESHLGKILAAAKALDVQIWLTGTSMPAAVVSSGLPYSVFHVEQGCISNKS